MDRNTYDIDWRTHGNRYYDPEIGRYLTRDPISYASGTANLYAHVNNNPINFFDPLGLKISVEGDEHKAKMERARKAKEAYESADTPEGRRAITREYRNTIDGINTDLRVATRQWERIREWNEAVHDDINMIRASGDRINKNGEVEWGGLGEELIKKLEEAEGTFRIVRSAGGSAFYANEDAKKNPLPGGTIAYDRVGRVAQATHASWGQSHLEALAHEMSHAYDWSRTAPTADGAKYFGSNSSGRFIHHRDPRVGDRVTEHRAVAVQNQIAADLGKDGRRLNYGPVKYDSPVTNPNYRTLLELQNAIPYNPPK